jgi:serine/threonine-protein kinase
MSEPESKPPEDSTVAARPSSRARPGGTGSGTPTPAPRDQGAPDAASGGRAIATPTTEELSGAELDRVLLGDELTRAHGIATVFGVLCFAVLPALPALDGDPTAKLLFGISLAIIGPMSLWLWFATRPQREYRRWILRTYVFTIAIGAAFIEYYIGVFSPVLVLLALGIYFVSQSGDPVQSLVVPAFVIAAHATMAVLMTAGVVSDRGLIAATQASFSSHVFIAVAGSGVLVFTTYLARMARASMRETIARSNEAMLLAQRREALLVEAQQHLQRALQVAVGKPGHYTGKLAGPYRLDVIIGFGAMGEIYAAKHVESDHSAAVKLLQPNVQERPDLVERFLREGEICQRLDSPHLVQVHAVGRLDSGEPYLAMELLEGCDLAALLRKENSLPLHAIVELARALAEGLGHAHDAGVIHRDLKPVNVFRTQGPAGQRWKILDFGISKLSTGTGTLTQVGIVGTPGYMSPEQARGYAVDHRSDIFSMAVVLYRALTGRPAFTGSAAPQIMFDVVYKTPERPSSIIKELPAEIDLVLAIGLAKDPKDRWASARDFASALELASRRAIDPEVKARARGLVKANPWGELAAQVARG